MDGIVIIVVFILLGTLTSIYFMKSTLVCHHCKSKDITKTGGKRYKEASNIMFFGSPDSFVQAEYKCKKCGHIFWEGKRIPGTS